MKKYGWITVGFLNKEHSVNNKSLCKIARENEIPQSSIFCICKKLGFKYRTRKEANKLHFTKQLDNNLLIELYINKKMSMKDLAEKFEVTIGTIHNRLHELKVEVREKHKVLNVWNKGLTTKTSKKLRDSICKGAKSKKGQIPWNKGVPHTKEQKQKLRDNHCSKKEGFVHPWKGQEHSEETKKKLSLLKGGTGIPYENAKHPKEFSKRLKEFIRKIFGYKCFLCKMSQKEHLEEYKAKLTVHHIDEDKTNNEIINLVPLCRSCHANVHNMKWRCVA